MAQIQLEDFLKGLGKIPPEQRSSSKTEETKSLISEMIGPEVIKNPKDRASSTAVSDLNSASVARDIKDLKNTQSKLLQETKKTNTLLTNFMNSESKVFENNNELIERLLIAQEQEKERKTQTGEKFAKTASSSESSSKSRAADVATGSAGLFALLFGLAPEILKAIEEVPHTLRDAAVASGILIKRAMYRFADSIETTVADVTTSIAERLGIKKPVETPKATAEPVNTSEAVASDAAAAAEDAAEIKRMMGRNKATAEPVNTSEAVASDAKARNKATAEPVNTSEAVASDAAAAAEDAAEIKRMKKRMKARNNASTQNRSNGRFAKGRVEPTEVKPIEPPAPDPMPKPPGAAGAAVASAEEAGVKAEATLMKKLGAFLGKNAVKAAAKTIPFAGAALAGFGAYEDASRGDLRGAIANSIVSIGSLMSATGIGAVVGEPAAIAASIEDLIDKAYSAVYVDEKTGEPADYWSDMNSNPSLFAKRVAWLAPKVAEAVYKELEQMGKLKPDEEEVTVEEDSYDPATGVKTGTSYRTEKRKKNPSVTPSIPQTAATASPSQPGMAQARAAESKLSITPVTRSSPRIDRDGQGGTVIVNDNKTITNVDNSKSGGSGGASGFPNTSTAPTNPWDGALYGD